MTPSPSASPQCASKSAMMPSPTTTTQRTSKSSKSHLQARELTAIVLLFCGIIMAFIALFLPPPGEIHSSVLYIFAQILIYAGSIFGIDAYVRKAVEREREESIRK